MEKRELLQELTGLIYDLNSIDPEHDWMMSFSGHVDSFGVWYSVKEGGSCECCGAPSQQKNTNITVLSSIEEIEPIIEEVRVIKNRLQEDKNE